MIIITKTISILRLKISRLYKYMDHQIQERSHYYFKTLTGVKKNNK